jgi:hypothetical protein
MHKPTILGIQTVAGKTSRIYWFLVGLGLPVLTCYYRSREPARSLDAGTSATIADGVSLQAVVRKILFSRI